MKSFHLQNCRVAVRGAVYTNAVVVVEPRRQQLVYTIDPEWRVLFL